MSDSSKRKKRARREKKARHLHNQMEREHQNTLARIQTMNADELANLARILAFEIHRNKVRLLAVEQIIKERKKEQSVDIS